MRKLRRRILPVLAIALAVMALTPQSANAQLGVAQAALAGDGVIQPGLTTVPTAQHTVSFDGTLAGGFGDGDLGFLDIGLGILDCVFIGASEIPEWDVQGKGHWVVNCQAIATGIGANTRAPTDVTPSFDIDCFDFHYDRIGPVFVAADHDNVPRGNHCDLTICFDHGCTTSTVEILGVWVWWPTSVQPFTSYQLTGVISALP